MAKKSGFIQSLVFLYLAIFPLGQLLRMNTLIGDFQIVFHPADILIGAMAFGFLLKKILAGERVYDFNPGLLWVLLFSFLFSFGIFRAGSQLEGFLYMVRLMSYYLFALILKGEVVKYPQLKRVYFDALVMVIVFVGLFGWIQYLVYPDVRSLYYLGWDDHLYRLVGTFLDPGFTGILLVFGINLSLVMLVLKFQKRWLLPLFVLLPALLLTYSRAGYITLIGSAAVLFWMRGRKKIILPCLAFFALLVLLLPRPSSSGVQLERLYSVFLRIENYRETINIWKKWPLFGVGYNNMCLGRVTYLGEGNTFSHSCSGSDSSLLLVLTTTGAIGLFLFLKNIRKIVSGIERDLYGTAFLICLTGLFVHSLFVNSLFYPWVMGFLAILFALTGTTSKNEE